MNSILAASISLPSDPVGLLVTVAIIAIVAWAIFALVKWSGIPIPQPVWIVLAALIGIFLILLIAKLFSAAI